MSEMIDIDGTKVSKDTIKEALKKHCGFKEEPKWIAASTQPEGDRLIINLAALSGISKRELIEALEKGYTWVSFDSGGLFGAWSKTNDGLTNYRNTKIIFGE